MNSLRQSANRQAYTLLEIIIAMFIVMLLLGLAIALTREVFGNEELRKTGQQIALYAKTARRYAIRENRSYEVILDGNLLVLRPAENTVASMEDFGAIESETVVDEPQVYNIPPAVRIWIKPWGTDDWETPKEFVWTFMANGLCAPNRIKLQRGAAWMEATFNPLTANRQDEEWYLP
jgi:type II secretory pathway pseudopilin PulG